MAQEASGLVASPSEVIAAAIAPSVAKIRRSLGKEGADLDIAIDESTATLGVTLVRNRIVCEGCLLPEKLVRTMLTADLRNDAAASALKYKLETHNWILG